MTESTVTGELEMRWISVVDRDGRSRMEARWQVVGEAAASAAPHAA
ncbi:MAG TPA: hypothetical protein VMF51_13210 [Nocardioides sp.]|jgi:hypothetical protein|nr:hypothetical protein [Nocardioides sp.]HTW16087.1 hypothetical protein [Nocardioides sp.]